MQQDVPEIPVEQDFPSLWGWLAVACAGVMPVALAIPLSFQEKRNLNLTFFDPLIWLSAAIIIVLRIISSRGRGKLAREVLAWLVVVWPCFILLAISAVSLITLEQFDAGALKLAGKKLFQMSEYLLVTPFVMLIVLKDKQWRDRAMWALTIGAVVTVAAVVRTPLDKVFAGEDNPHFVGGLLGNRNTYGIWMAVALPLLAGWAHFPRRAEAQTASGGIWKLLPALFLPFMAIYPMLAAGTLVALLAGMAIVWLAHYRAGFALIFGLLAWVVYADSGSGSDARLRELARSVQVYRPYTDPDTGEEEGRYTMRYIRWTANLNMIRKNPLLGVGLGQYQKRISEYYGDIPRPPGTTDDPRLYDIDANEPLTFSWFFEIAGECGLLGLGAWLLLVGELFVRAIGRDRKCIFAFGVAASLLALMMACPWTSPMVRGAGPILGLLIAVSGISNPVRGEQ